jgi:hypothetical protein
LQQERNLVLQWRGTFQRHFGELLHGEVWKGVTRLLRSEKLGWKCDNNLNGQEEPSPITGRTKGEQMIFPNPAELTRELTGTLMTYD